MLYKLQRKAAKFGEKKTVRVAAKRRIIRIADRFNSSLYMDYGTVFEEMIRKHKHKEQLNLKAPVIWKGRVVVMVKEEKGAHHWWIGDGWIRFDLEIMKARLLLVPWSLHQ